MKKWGSWAFERPAGHSCAAWRSAVILLGVFSVTGTKISSTYNLLSSDYACLIFFPFRMVWSGQVRNRGLEHPLWYGGEHNCEDFSCCQVTDPLPVSSLSHLRLLSASGHAPGQYKKFRLTPFPDQLFGGRWGEASLQCSKSLREFVFPHLW